MRIVLRATTCLLVLACLPYGFVTASNPSDDNEDWTVTIEAAVGEGELDIGDSLWIQEGEQLHIEAWSSCQDPPIKEGKQGGLDWDSPSDWAAILDPVTTNMKYSGFLKIVGTVKAGTAGDVPVSATVSDGPSTASMVLHIFTFDHLKVKTIAPVYDHLKPGDYVENEQNELEKNDTLVLQVEASANITGDQVQWGGGTVSGTGLEKAIPTTATGTKTITVTIGGKTLQTTIYVNDNASNPIQPQIQVSPSSYAHKETASEKLKLEALGTDNDWYNGVFSGTNYLDADSATWTTSMGYFFNDNSSGTPVYWIPNNIGPGLITLTCNDTEVAYGPRDESAQNAYATVYGFIVQVELTAVISGQNDPSALILTEEEEGPKAYTDYALTKDINVSASSSTSHEDIDPAGQTVAIQWQHNTDPVTALPYMRGKIEVDAKTGGSVKYQGSVKDQNGWETDVTFGYLVTWTWARGIDNDEAGVVGSAAFTGNYSFTSYAHDGEHQYLAASSSEFNRPEETVTTGVFSWSVTQSITDLELGKDADPIQATYEFNTCAWAHGGECGGDDVTTGSMTSSERKFTIEVDNVEYVP